MKPAAIIVLAAALAVVVTTESKVVSGKKDDSSGQTLPGTRPSDSGSDGNPPAADTGPSGEVRAATALQPQFVVPDNGEPRRSGDASARRSLAESGPRSRGRLLSLIDGVYQESLDRDGNTTYITPLDRVSEEPFELSVRRYSRFVESRAQRGGRMHAEEDLEDLLQRTEGQTEPTGVERKFSWRIRGSAGR
ncbi:hypothetical protein FJT64_013224 [Amphibalanus amphitrite]|uniref:Secreted protein n=1 Tax=Amphibalanus amphitrite TaxID=1232801 RepID=A0A6A4V455_AMPAM|nr:hypothetical protein FJT64_013224 [Amphibalanus amphitrite]